MRTARKWAEAYRTPSSRWAHLNKWLCLSPWICCSLLPGDCHPAALWGWRTSTHTHTHTQIVQWRAMMKRIYRVENSMQRPCTYSFQWAVGLLHTQTPQGPDEVKSKWMSLFPATYQQTDSHLPEDQSLPDETIDTRPVSWHRYRYTQMWAHSQMATKFNQSIQAFDDKHLSNHTKERLPQGEMWHCRTNLWALLLKRGR